MALPPNFLDELRARSPIAAVIGRATKLTRSGREHKGCCPFHGEKTPSFYVYDDHFHCFGCGEHGDVITFVMKSANLPFMEAVEQLAGEAGLDVPKQSPQAAEAEQRRAGIAEVLEAAAVLYHRWLFEPQGSEALEYLTKRGLSLETIKRFGLGWSGEGRGVLAAGLRGLGIKPDQLIEAGLMKQGDYGPADMFFSRVMFPIRDRKGVMSSFGGRIMGDGQPKYVNGPETPVFSKRRSLYGLNYARDAARKGAALIVAEGYMDVIALAQAGFGGAVAPLGTALTQEHLEELWRLSPEPIICFDADKAGRRAALKTVDLALGALAPDRSLKFLVLSEGDDPDSLINRDGGTAFKAKLDAARPISAALYDMLGDGVALNTPEARASFRNRLIETASRIPDKSLAGEYRAMLLDRFFAERRGTQAKGGKLAKPTAFRRERGKPDAHAANEARVKLMLATLLTHPVLIPQVEEAVARVEMNADHNRLRSALSSFALTTKSLDSEALVAHLTALGLGDEVRAVLSSIADHSAISQVSPARAAEMFWSWYSLMDFSIETLRSQRDEEQAFWAAHQDDQAAWQRLVHYNLLLRRAQSGEDGDAAQEAD